jgi:hypothetical protein
MSVALGLPVEKLLIPKILLLFLVSGNIRRDVFWHMGKTKPHWKEEDKCVSSGQRNSQMLQTSIMG